MQTTSTVIENNEYRDSVILMIPISSRPDQLHIAGELAVANNVQKQMRKADEERVLAQKNKKGNKKKGKEEE